MPTTAIIVPCRLESTRFPRKLLHPIKGKPLLLWVAERIAAQAPDFPLCFAVDHELLRDAVAARGFNAIMTSPAHASGTDRLAEANRTVRADHVINVQADEPLVTGGQIRELARLIGGAAPMATLATPFRRVVDFYNPNQVKVVFDRNGRALFFSRSRLPFSRDLGPDDRRRLGRRPSLLQASRALRLPGGAAGEVPVAAAGALRADRKARTAPRARERLRHHGRPHRGSHHRRRHAGGREALRADARSAAVSHKLSFKPRSELNALTAKSFPPCAARSAGGNPRRADRRRAGRARPRGGTARRRPAAPCGAGPRRCRR